MIKYLFHTDIVYVLWIFVLFVIKKISFVNVVKINYFVGDLFIFNVNQLI